MKSCIYVGQVRHRRFLPKQREFRYSLFMMYLDLAEIPTLFKGRLLWSSTHMSLAWFRREDHYGDPDISLDEQVRRTVQLHTGARPMGPIRVLTHLRYFGYCFNPVSFFYCFDVTDSRLETIVAEVSNTPWGERHCYVLNSDINQGVGGIKRYKVAKSFHVSPFIDMKQNYDWRFFDPLDSLSVHMQNSRQTDGHKTFDATLSMRRKEISSLNLALVLIRFPFMTGKVIFLIYFQALLMWLRSFPFFEHPKYSKTDTLKPHHASNNPVASEAPKRANKL